MSIVEPLGVCRSWVCILAIAAGLLLPLALAKAQEAPAEPAVAPAPEPAPDPIGFNGGPTETLLTPNSYLSGWPTGTMKPDGTWTAYADPANPTPQELSKGVAKSFYSINLVWMLMAGFLVMFMQAGFALVETGLCRAKNAAHTMSMNFLVYPLGMIGFFVCGFALMCGGVNGTGIGGPGMLGGIPVLNQMVTVGDGWGLFGKTGFLLAGRSYDAMAIAWFLFMMVFMDTTATIPTGALAERWSTKSFFIFSLFIGALIYPIYGCWVWGGGWLAQLGYKVGLGHGVVDYAGSSVVHLQGGSIALITCLLLGPRIGKYNKDGTPRPILGHHIPMVILGTFILAFGWFGFNAGSSLAGTDGRIGVVAVNTMLAGAFATFTGVLYMWMVHGKPDPSMMCNSCLAGLVAITAPCAFVTPWAAAVIGSIAGVLVVWSAFFWDRCGVDDPVGAISVHGVNGAWGLLALGLFADGTYGAGWNAVGYSEYLGTAGLGVTGLFYGDAKQFFAQAIGVTVCILWNVIAAGAIFWLIGKAVHNRVPAEVEIAGLDIPEMGAPGYPEFISSMAPEQVPAEAIEDARASIPQAAAVPAMG
jgi:Amt family ammonium transporter